MKYFSLVVFTTVSLIATAQKSSNENFILNGNVTDQKDGFTYLSYQNKEGKFVRDSAALKNGTFRFAGTIDGPTMATVSAKLVRSSGDVNYSSIFLEPVTMKITTAKNDFKNAKITGSKSQAEYEVFQKQINIIRDRWKVVMDTLTAVNKRSNFEYQELKDWVLQPYNAEIREIELAFINSHPSSYVTAYLLRVFGRELSTDSLRLIYNRFPEKVKQSTYGKVVAADLEKRKIGIPGTIANNFTTVDINGNKVSLSDFRGKYVLLDFWASWCVPCRKLNPHLKELYAKYKDKGFEVVGISDDDRNHEAWKKAVADDKLPWEHVLRGLKTVNGVFDRSTDINEGYNISTLPTHILIDRTGKIIGRYGEDGEDHSMLDQKLKSIFE